VAVLERCLDALTQSRGVTWECIVVDDGSTDASATIAARFGARVLSATRPGSGPGRARNEGAAAAKASLLLFLDADVLVRPDTLAQFVSLFDRDPDLAAAFGSYDANPAAPGLASQYRNLLHHYVHQHGQEAASTFWSGCGAMKRSIFLSAGGFHSAYTRPCIEDIELGYRLSARGERIRLAKHIQVTHLKRWTVWSILKTDIFDRALPWTALIRRTHYLPNDLNLRLTDRLSAVTVYLLLGVVATGWWRRTSWLVTLPLVAVLLVSNWNLYQFFLRQRGLRFLPGAILLHWLYYAYSAVAFGLGTLLAGVDGLPSWLKTGPRRREAPSR
jgi:GT2 family glycosyltransferase